MGTPGWTRKPCHGCGSTDLHRKDKVCLDCQKIYDDGLLARKKQNQQQDKIMVKHDSVYHVHSGPYLFEHSARVLGRTLNDKLRHAWHEHTMIIIEPAIGKKRHESPYLITNKSDLWGVKNDFYGYHDDEYFLVAPQVRNTLNELDLSIRLALEFVYLAGFAQGSNILIQLNQGTKSSSSFEDNLNRVEHRIEQLQELLQQTSDKHSPENV